MDEAFDFCTILAVHPDILQAHILARLDGPTLASVGTTSSKLRTLSADNTLWLDICHREWPSTAHPLLHHLITSFPSGHRSFYADSSSRLNRHGISHTAFHCSAPWSPTLISAADIYYKKSHVLSKVQEMDTLPVLYTGSPFRVGLLDPEESFPIPGRLDFKDLTCKSELENNLTLSWIIINPIQTRAASLTSMNPVCVDRDWSNGDFKVRFGTVLSGGRKGELVECGVVVTCGREWDSQDLHIKQVTLEIEDVKGNKLGWRESFVILHEAMESGGRTKRREEKRGYEEFLEMKRERSKRRQRRDRRQEMVGICTGFVVVLGFWVFAMARFIAVLGFWVCVAVRCFQLLYSSF